MTTLTISAHTVGQLGGLDQWIVDSWLNAPVGTISAERELTLSIEVSLTDARAGLSPGLPRPRRYRTTSFYEEHEQPVVASVLTVRHVEKLITSPEEGLPLSSGIAFDQTSRILAFDDDVLQLRVSELAVDLEVTQEVTEWTRKRHWQIGPLSFFTEA